MPETVQVLLIVFASVLMLLMLGGYTIGRWLASFAIRVHRRMQEGGE